MTNYFSFRSDLYYCRASNTWYTIFDSNSIWAQEIAVVFVWFIIYLFFSTQTLLPLSVLFFLLTLTFFYFRSLVFVLFLLFFIFLLDLLSEISSLSLSNSSNFNLFLVWTILVCTINKKKYKKSIICVETA